MIIIKGGIFIFDNKKFITCGVEKNIPPLLQSFLWELIFTLPVDKDYLQVFNLSAEGDKQIVKHTQEVPVYNKEYIFEFENPVAEKIFVIDDGTHSTMLLANEY